MEIVAVAWQRYQKQLGTHPLRTKAFTAAYVSLLSELIGQKITKSAAPADVKAMRAAKFALFGLLWSGPSIHFWQRRVEAWFKGCPPTPKTAALKVLLDQVTYGPASNLAVMAFIALVVDGRSAKAFATSFGPIFPKVQARAWRFWPIVAGVNYQFVPIPFRALVANFAGLIWSTYIVVSNQTKPALSAPPPQPSTSAAEEVCAAAGGSSGDRKNAGTATEDEDAASGKAKQS